MLIGLRLRSCIQVNTFSSDMDTQFYISISDILCFIIHITVSVCTHPFGCYRNTLELQTTLEFPYLSVTITGETIHAPPLNGPPHFYRQKPINEGGQKAAIANQFLEESDR